MKNQAWWYGYNGGARHPKLKTSTGTIQVRPRDAAAISDDEFRDLVHAALDA
jgi:hypothetical protein